MTHIVFYRERVGIKGNWMTRVKKPRKWKKRLVKAKTVELVRQSISQQRRWQRRDCAIKTWQLDDYSEQITETKKILFKYPYE